MSNTHSHDTSHHRNFFFSQSLMMSQNSDHSELEKRFVTF